MLARLCFSLHSVVWQRAETCMAGDVRDKGGACVQERWPQKRAVRIPLECILVFRELASTNVTINIVDATRPRGHVAGPVINHHATAIS